MPKTIYSLTPLIFFILALISGCTPIAINQTASPTPSTPIWIAKWLDQPACSPPCWENIQPGTTTVDSIQTTLAQYGPNIDVVTKPGSTVVQSVRLFFSLHENLPLSLLISKYGIPDYVRISLCDSTLNCDVHVLFLKIGMVLSLYTPDIGEWAIKDRVAISSNTRVIQIYFLETGLEKYYDLYPADSHHVTPWNGYEEYP